MPDKYTPASEVAAIGNKLIKKHHDHLSGRRVEFLFMERLDKDGQSQAITRKGKSLYGQAKLVTGLNAFLACAPRAIEDPAPLFVILISKHYWTNASQEFKHALVDHELSHCWYDSEHDKFSTIEHDVTEFTAIVKRHGLWHHELDVFFKAAKQERFKFDDETSLKTLAAHDEAESIGERIASPPTDATLRTPKVRRMRGAKSKEQATEILGG